MLYSRKCTTYLFVLQICIKCELNTHSKVLQVKHLNILFFLRKLIWKPCLRIHTTGLEYQEDHGDNGLHYPGICLGAPSKCSHRHSDILMEVPFTQEKWSCPLQKWNSRPDTRVHPIKSMRQTSWIICTPSNLPIRRPFLGFVET